MIDIREIIREAVREVLRRLLPTNFRPLALSITEAVREKVHRAVQPEVPITTVAPEEPTLSYAPWTDTRRKLPAKPRRHPEDLP